MVSFASLAQSIPSTAIDFNPILLSIGRFVVLSMESSADRSSDSDSGKLTVSITLTR